MNSLIRKKATGTPKEFASRMNISVSMLYEYLSVMKKMDVPVKYSKLKQTYYYTEEGDFELHFKTNKSSIN
jgi:predicted DNA-binding transcriptional regulator YafY